MTPEYSRRECIGLLGATTVGSLALPGTGAGTVGSIQSGTETETDCERLAALESEYEELQASTRTLTAEIERIEDRLVEERARYPPDVRESAREVGTSIREGVAFLDMDDGHGVGGEATGWFVEPDLVVTNRHNIEHVTPEWELRGWLPDGTGFEWDVLAEADPSGPDIAVLSADRSVDPLPVASDPVATGDHLVQVGHPGGAGTWVISLGEVRSVVGDAIETDVPGLQGVSGSPVVNLDGEVVGVTFGADVDVPTSGPPEASPTEVHYELLAPEGEALHVPIDVVMELLEGWT